MEISTLLGVCDENHNANIFVRQWSDVGFEIGYNTKYICHYIPANIRNYIDTVVITDLKQSDNPISTLLNTIWRLYLVNSIALDSIAYPKYYTIFIVIYKLLACTQTVIWHSSTGTVQYNAYWQWNISQPDAKLKHQRVTYMTMTRDLQKQDTKPNNVSMRCGSYG